MPIRSFLLGASVAASLMPALAQHAIPAATQEQAAKLQLAPGFRLAVWAAEPQLSNGVAFHIDPRGRAWIAESHRWSRSIFDITQRTNWLLNDLAFRTVADRVTFLESQFDAIDPGFLTRDSEIVRLVEDTDGDGTADRSSLFADGFNSAADGTAAGVLATRDTVYFANIPNLWRLSPPGTEAGPRREILASGFGVHVGVSGHDLHGLVLGPDGRLYMSFGDRGASITNREGRRIDLPDMGAVLRCEPDGANLEVFCVGLRNPQELAFDDDGNLWTVDNDTAGADPCRVLHLVEDGDYGWRASYQHMDGFGPWVQEELWKGTQDNVLPPAGTVSQGPSGLAFYPGTGFGTALANTFLHCDFPGGIWSYTVRPRGASFEVASKSRFLWNCWPTDVDFGPDGAAYVLDWVAGWGQPLKGRIYRITPATPPDEAEKQQRDSVRRILDEGLTSWAPKEILRLLAHADRRVRLEAQFELARRGPSQLRPLSELALAQGSSLARRHALWGIGQILRASGRGTRDESGLPILTELLPLLSDPDTKVAAVAARLLGEGRLASADRPLASLLDHPDPALRFAAAMGLGSRLAPDNTDVQLASEAIRTLARTHATNDPFLLHAVVRHGIRLERRFAAGQATDALSPDLRASLSDPHPAVRLAAVLTLRGLRHPHLAQLLSDPDRSVVIAAGRAIHDAPVAAGFPALSDLLTRVDCPTNLFSRSIAAAFRLGTAQKAQTLAALAKRRDPPPAVRALALHALGDWASPPMLDRVNGLWRPTTALPRGEAPPTPQPERATRSGTLAAIVPALPEDLGRSLSFEEASAIKRNPEPARRAFLRVADEILNPSTPDEYGQVIGGGPAPIEVQLALVDTALRLRTREAAQPLFEKFSQTNSPPALRRAILGFLASINAVQAPDAVRLALADTEDSVRAAAIPHLDRLDAATALPVLRPLLDARALPVVQAAYRALPRLANADADALILAALEELLAGRLRPELHLDVLGAAEVREKDAPALHQARARWIGSRTNREPLALLAPVMRGGDATRGGLIFKNNPQVQCLRCHKVGGDGGTVGPALDGIGKLRDRTYLLEAIIHPNKTYAEGYKPPEGGLSAMPEGLGDLLTPFELRDVVEFLSGLR